MQHSKRAFLRAGAGVAALAAVPRAFAQWQPSQRYPDPAIKIVDPSFARYRLALAKVERIASGTRWNEGPVWFGDGRYLLWSDIPNNRIMKWRSEEHTSELQSRLHLVCRLLLEKKKKNKITTEICARSPTADNV